MEYLIFLHSRFIFTFRLRNRRKLENGRGFFIGNGVLILDSQILSAYRHMCLIRREAKNFNVRNEDAAQEKLVLSLFCCYTL